MNKHSQMLSPEILVPKIALGSSIRRALTPLNYISLAISCVCPVFSLKQKKFLKEYVIILVSSRQPSVLGTANNDRDCLQYAGMGTSQKPVAAPCRKGWCLGP